MVHEVPPVERVRRGAVERARADPEQPAGLHARLPLRDRARPGAGGLGLGRRHHVEGAAGRHRDDGPPRRGVLRRPGHAHAPRPSRPLGAGPRRVGRLGGDAPAGHVHPATSLRDRRRVVAPGGGDPARFRRAGGGDRVTSHARRDRAHEAAGAARPQPVRRPARRCARLGRPRHLDTGPLTGPHVLQRRSATCSSRATTCCPRSRPTSGCTASTWSRTIRSATTCTRSCV